MKKKIISKILALLIILISVASCKKFLDKKSDTTLVSPVSLSDLQGVLDDFSTMNSATPSFGEASADDYFLLLTTYNSQAILNQKAYTWTVDNYNFPNDWASCYNAVYNANLCLEQIESVLKTEQNKDQWNNIKGSAKFFRAFYFLNLAGVFTKNFDPVNSDTDLGIVLRLGSNFNDVSNRSTVSQTYSQIIADFKEANLLLPDHPLQPSRPSKAASFALLARTFLNMGYYDSAYKYSSLSLQIKNTLIDFNDANDIDPTSTAPIKPFNKEILFYATMSNGFSVKSPGTALIDSILYSTYANNDQRKNIFFRNSGQYKRFKGSYASSSTTLFSGIAVDEVLLIRAECHARAGRITEAMNDLNSLLIKRWATGTFIPFTANTQTQALNIILLERRKELLMRGIRWTDIKRLNKDGANITPLRKVGSASFVLAPNANKYALPLPTDIISLTGMIQNPL